MAVSPYLPAYRLTVYAPRSVDSTEATVLVPRVGSVHTDPFVVTSIRNVTGAKPYLDIPKGKQGSIDPLTKARSTGSLTLRLLDAKVGASGGNAVRWVTTFFGDANNKQQLINCKSKLEESLDNGVTWAAIFTGRIHKLSLDGALYVALEVWDMGIDMGRSIFVGIPHSSITYAFTTSFLPVGLPKSFGSGTAKATAPLPAVVDGTASGSVTLRIVESVWGQGIVTKAGRDAMSSPAQRIQMTDTTTSVSGRYFPTSSLIPFAPREQIQTFANGKNGQVHWRRIFVDRIRTMALFNPPKSPSTVLPALNDNVTVYFTLDGEPSAALPLMIDDIHPIQLLADLADGKLSALDDSGNATAIVSRTSAAATPAWSTLIADTSFPMFRGVVPKVDKFNAWIEKAILQIYQVGYYLDGTGAMVPVDLRRSSTSGAGLTTITDTDLAELSPVPKWMVSRDKAVTGTELTYYIDQPNPVTDYGQVSGEFPDIEATGFQSVPMGYLVVNDATTLKDIGEKLVKIDAVGVRSFPNEMEIPTTHLKISAGVNRLIDWATEMMAPFATGAATLPIRLRRSSPATSIYPGSLAIVTVTTQPDPATNQRGGARLMLCTSRTEDGLAVGMEFLDTGSTVVAVVPAITSQAVATDDPNAIDVVLTLGADTPTSPAQVMFAVTPAGTAVSPTIAAAAWTNAGQQLAAGTFRIHAVARGTRVWIRARSRPQGQALKLPSAWVTAGTAYVDMTTVLAPSGLATSNLFANRTDLAWTVGDATLTVEVFLTAGGVPGTWTEAMKVNVLDPGSAKVRLFGMTATTQYTAGVRHRDGAGGAGAMATNTFTSGGSLGVAPTMIGVYIPVAPSA